MNMATKKEIFKEKLEEYLKGSKAEKSKILDSVCAVITGIHRKSVIRRFKRLQFLGSKSPKKAGRKKKYGTQINPALTFLWELSSCVCAERLHPVMHEYVRVLKEKNHWKYDQNVTDLVLTISLGTLKNRLRAFGVPGKKRGLSSTRASGLKELIPIRRGPWKNPDPGFGEIDTVAHCGTTLKGDYGYTVQYTDVATIWTALGAQWNKGQIETVNNLKQFKERIPFPMKGLDPDSGSEFINYHLKEWADEQKIILTRTRPYKKNDHARIEQKNYTNVRNFVGYGRFDTLEHVEILKQIYVGLEDYINYFVPSMKCIKKTKVKKKTVRKYQVSQTAYQRVLSHKKISQDVKDSLKIKYQSLDPLVLKKSIDALIHKLCKIPSKLR